MSGRLDAPRRCSSPPDGATHDRFAALVAAVAADPESAYNIERYLWVLDEPLRRCAACGAWFDPAVGYDGGPAHGHTRRHCSRRCAWRAAEHRRRGRNAARRGQRAGRWGSAA